MDREQRKTTAYTVELIGATTLYAISLFVRGPLLRATPDGVLHTLILLLPILPILLMAAVIVRHYLRLDEYFCHLFLQSFAVCAAVAACLTSSFPFLKDAFGLHDISITFAWPVLGACWFVASFVTVFQQRAMARAAGA